MKTRNEKGQFVKGFTPFNKGKSMPRGSMAYHWKGGLPECLDCGKELVNYDHKYCLKHTYLHRKRRKPIYTMSRCIDCGKQLTTRFAKRCQICMFKGKRSYRWKGGITSEDRLQRVKFRIHVQKRVFERDNYTCQICGKRGKYLQVDHIQSWAECVRGRFDLNNCRTLCMDCHYFITFNKKRPKNIIWGHNFKGLERMVD